MPLDRAHITVASRLMLPVYIVFFTVVGISFTFGDTHRLTASPMLRYADQLMSIRVWGLLFLTCAAIMAIARVRNHRDLYRYGLLVCASSMITWSAVAILGAFAEPVSYSAWVWPAFVAAACIASNRSLARGERDSTRRED